MKLKFLLPICLSLVLGIASASEGKTLEDIDQELDRLSKELNDKQRDAFNAEIEGQSYMFDDWSDYAKRLAQAEQDEHAIKKIQRRMAELQSQKQALLQNR